MNWRLFFLLWIASVIGIILVLPYGLAMIPASLSSKPPPLHVLVPLQVAQGAIFLGLLTLAGLFFANRIGLSAPILEAWIEGQGIRTRLNSILVPSVLIGVLGTLLILALELAVFQPAIRHQNPNFCICSQPLDPATSGLEGTAGFLLRRLATRILGDDDLFVSNSLEIPKEQGRTRYLLPDEEEALFSVLIGRRAHLRQIVDLYINTGMRENELLRLPTDMVDFHRNLIYLKDTKGDIDHAIPMNVHARETLRALVSKAQSKGYRYIFTNKATGKPYTSLKTAWKTACKQAGITNLRIHDLRHTFGTRAADAGAPLRAIQDVMGHSSIAMTERYAHATDEGKRRVVEAAGLKRAVVVKMASKKAVGE